MVQAPGCSSPSTGGNGSSDPQHPQLQLLSRHRVTAPAVVVLCKARILREVAVYNQSGQIIIFPPT